MQDIVLKLNHAVIKLNPFREFKVNVYGNVSTGVLDKNKEHYLRCKGKAKKYLTYQLKDVYFIKIKN